MNCKKDQKLIDHDRSSCITFKILLKLQLLESTWASVSKSNIVFYLIKVNSGVIALSKSGNSKA